jgi:hypothetical protein
MTALKTVAEWLLVTFRERWCHQIVKISPFPSFPKREIDPPFGKGGLELKVNYHRPVGGFARRDYFITTNNETYMVWGSAPISLSVVRRLLISSGRHPTEAILLITIFFSL